MTFHKVWIAAGLALAIGSIPAWGADWGGVKDIGGGVAVPVPAPVPVPTYDADSDWYVGLALGGVVSQDADITSTNIDDLGIRTPGLGARDSDDIGSSPIFGLSFGRYITPSLRAEIAIDYNRRSTIAESRQDNIAVQSMSALSAATDPLDGATFDSSDYNVARDDTVTLSRTTGLFNLLYDIRTGTRFTPYIGGGFGFTWRQTRRNFNETSTCFQSTNSFYGDYAGCLNTEALPSSFTKKGSETKDQINFAAAVQAGLAYEINEWISWDNGWQMLWEQGAISSLAPTAGGENRVVYKDAVLHQFRSGLRIKFD